jgi:predicted DNA-binding transcriptional regulator YafY
VLYGEIKLHEKRLYLDAWCQETNPDANIPELTHNRCFRLDRVKHITRLSAHWRSQGLDFIEVTLHFYGNMIKAYESKLEDIETKLEEDKLKVIRKISNPFWLIREVLPYGKNCQIISPEIVRQEYIKEFNQITQLYGLRCINAE